MATSQMTAATTSGRYMSALAKSVSPALKLMKVLTTATEAREMPVAAGIPSSRTRPDVCRMKRRPAPESPAVAVPAAASLLATAYLQAPASANTERGSRVKTQFTCVTPQAEPNALARTRVCQYLRTYCCSHKLLGAEFRPGGGGGIRSGRGGGAAAQSGGRPPGGLSARRRGGGG